MNKLNLNTIDGSHIRVRGLDESKLNLTFTNICTVLLDGCLILMWLLPLGLSLQGMLLHEFMDGCELTDVAPTLVLALG